MKLLHAAILFLISLLDFFDISLDEHLVYPYVDGSLSFPPGFSGMGEFKLFFCGVDFSLAVV